MVGAQPAVVLAVVVMGQSGHPLRIVIDPYATTPYYMVAEDDLPFKVIGRGEYERLLRELAPATAGADDQELTSWGRNERSS